MSYKRLISTQKKSRLQNIENTCIIEIESIWEN